MKKLYSIVIFLLIAVVLLANYWFSMPRNYATNQLPLSEFSEIRAIENIKSIASKPHYVGSANHEEVAQYLANELSGLGLEVSFQEDMILFDDENILLKPKNIIAKIKGSTKGKALLLLSHYDSAPHSNSYGASDAGSGVATIIEAIRAFQYKKIVPKNDIIVMFSDAEEVGLNGAALFVKKHALAQDIGLVLNFEARGTKGPSYMFMETNHGNAGMVQAFANADTKYANANSLMYSIYKLLPNDTDLTVFRVQGDIQGFNFAFIDEHYNYHTEQDNIANIDANTIAHQGSYLMPLLTYFADTNLTKTLSSNDEVYFTIPFQFFHYPSSYIFTLVWFALILFVVLLAIGFGRKVIDIKSILSGVSIYIGNLALVVLITFLGWKFILYLYPQYNDLLNGFTYNGHLYIAFFMSLTIAVCFFFYQFADVKRIGFSGYIAPLMLWLILNFAMAYQLEGGSFLIIPLYGGLILFGIYVLTGQSFTLLNFIFSIPALLLIGPFILTLPIGLGLKMLFVSALLCVQLFGLLLPLFMPIKAKAIWGFTFLLISVVFFVSASRHSDYNVGEAKSNSLVYWFDADTNKPQWRTYDKNLDAWTKRYLGKNPIALGIDATNNLSSKYNSCFTFAAKAPKIDLAKPTIVFEKDSIAGNLRYFKIKITANRAVNRYDILTNHPIDLYDFRANGQAVITGNQSRITHVDHHVMRYYVTDHQPLVLDFYINIGSVFSLKLLESSFDLLKHPLLTIKPRDNWMMPTPFVLNDAVIIEQSIKPTALLIPTKTTALDQPQQ
jgi:hypothetical protein